MTKVLTDSVEETYKQVFGNTLQEPDQQRIKFLRSVTSGNVLYEGKDVKLADAMAFAQLDIEGLVDEIKSAKKQAEKTQLTGDVEACQEALDEYEAVSEMRTWYLAAEKESIQTSKVCVLQPLFQANLSYVVDTIEDCMKVLYKERIKSLIQSFYDAFEVKKCRDAAISARAEQLLAKNIPALTEAIMERMIPYHARLKELLDNAVNAGRKRAIKRAVMRLNDTGVPSLIQYAGEKVKDTKITSAYHASAASQ